MNRTFTKYVSENNSWALDWTDYLSNANNGAPDTIATSVWQVPAGITKVSDSIDGKKAIVRLSGGTAGESYICENTITMTTSGYTKPDYLTMLVIADPIP